MAKGSFKFLFFCTAVLLFVYILARAYLLSFTYDECSSFLYIHGQDYHKLFGTANNHLLNSFFIWIISNYIGYREIYLRLPNVLSFLIYLFYLFHFLQLMEKKWVRIFGVVFFLLNPYILDFFSLARGYGLAIAFCMASIYYFFKATDAVLSIQIKNRIKTAGWGVLAVLSNLSMLNYFLAMMLVFVIQDLMLRRLTASTIFNWLKQNYGIGLLILLLSGILFPVLKILVQNKALFYGGKNGFWQDTVNSLVDVSLYGQSYYSWVKFVIHICIALTTLWLGFIAVKQLMKNKTISSHTSLLLILFFSVTSPILQKILFKTPLPLDRTALVYILLFGAFIVVSLDKITSTKNINWLLNSACIVLTVLMTLNFAKAVNFKYTLNWKFDADTKYAVEEIRKKIPLDGFLLIGANWEFEQSMTYYKIKNNYNWYTPSILNYPWANNNDNKPAQNKTYQIYYLGNSRDVGDVFKKQNLNKVKYFETSGSVIYENLLATNHALDRRNYEEFVTGKSHGGLGSLRIKPDVKFPSAFEFSIKELKHQDIDEIKISLYFYSDSTLRPGQTFLVISYEKEKTESTRYKVFDIKDYQKGKLNQWNNLVLTEVIPHNIPEDYKLKIYIWNKGDGQFYVDDFTIEPSK